jgi:hypothetical protein
VSGGDLTKKGSEKEKRLLPMPRHIMWESRSLEAQGLVAGYLENGNF